MFDSIVGNNHVKTVLRRLLTENRIPGALLLSGNDGIGKKLFALELAKAFNCTAPMDVEPCGQCAACTRISQVTRPPATDRDALRKILWTHHPDVGLLVPPNRVFRVDQMRELEREANFRPYEGKRRVFIIENAEQLNEASSNALLKTLEEPSPTSMVILLTSRPEVLLPTILSRCQTVRFVPLRRAEVQEFLTEKANVPPEEASILAKAASGSLGRALEVDLAEYLERRKSMLEVLEAAILREDRAALFRASELLSDARRKDSYESTLESLEQLLHDIVAIKVHASEAVLNDDLQDRLRQLVPRLSVSVAASWIDQIEELRAQLAVNINRRIATDALFLSMLEKRAA